MVFSGDDDDDDDAIAPESKFKLADTFKHNYLTKIQIYAIV